MEQAHNVNQSAIRFIVRHSDGTATLNYPGWPSKSYGSVNAALNRRRAIDLGLAKQSKSGSGSSWTEEERKFVSENWGLILPHEWPSRLPGRTYAAIKTFARNNKLSASKIRRSRPSNEIGPRCITGWTSAEIDILKTNSLSEAKRLLQPSRTTVAVEKMVHRTFPDHPDIRKFWTSEEIRILYDNTPLKAWELLSGSRTKRAVEHMMAKMGVRSQPLSERWSESEVALVRNIIRSIDALVSRHNRTLVAIHTKVGKERRRKKFADAAMEVVKNACENLESSIRHDVEGEILLLVLSKKIDISQVGDTVRSTRTRIYGRRHFSLDAPIGDGSTTWIENISSDQSHF